MTIRNDPLPRQRQSGRLMPRPYVLGLDPSITAMGVAGIDGELYVVGGAASLGDARLLSLARCVAESALGIDLAVIEDLPTHAHGAGITGMVQGVIRLELLRAKILYALIPAASLKLYATGKGNADKATMRMELYKRTGLDEPNDNKVDAMWLRMMGLDHLGHPVVEMPAVNRKGLDKVKWPS